MVHDGWGPRWSGATPSVAVEERQGQPSRPARTGTGRRRARRRAVVVAVVLAVLVAGWAAWLVGDVLRARSALERAAADLPGLQETVSSGGDASAGIEEVQEAARTAADATTGPHWRLARLLPVVGDDARALGDVATAVDGLAAQALPRLARAAEAAAPARLVPRDGAVDLAPLEEARADVLAADAAVAAAATTVAHLDTATLVEPLARAVDDLGGRLAEIRSSTQTAARAVDLVPPMLGADGPRDYLVLVQNNAEPRATGGIAGSVLHVRAQDGRLELVEVRPGNELTGESSAVPLSRAEQALFGDDLGRYMLNVTSTPDFPRAAAVARQIWADRTGTQVDGVLAVDPVALQGVLDATGPVTFTDPGGAEVRLTGDDAAGFLLNGVYRRYEDPATQDTVLAAAAHAVLDALTTSAGAEPARVVGALADASRAGRLLVWSADDGEQARLAGTVLSGELAGVLPGASGGDPSPVLGVYLNASSASKTGYYLSTSVRVDDVTCRPDGSQRFTAAVTLTSTLTPEEASTLPAYVAGARDGDGTIRANLLVYAPRNGGILGARGPQGDLGLFSQVHEDLVVGARTVALAPGESATYRYDVVSGKSQRGIVSVRKTPGASAVPDELPTVGCTARVLS